MSTDSNVVVSFQIVAMRHIVRRTKVHTINKLSREAKKLKLKKGNEKQIEKNKKKAERFVNELLVIKVINVIINDFNIYIFFFLFRN